MKKIIALFGLISLLYSQNLLAADQPPQPGEVWPNLSLSAPVEQSGLVSPGIGGGTTFNLTSIKAKVVVVQVFSMYCPYCQAEAPRVNQLYQRLVDMPQLKDRVKILGIGAGNSAFEVEVFRQTYHIPFPLVPDEDYSVHRALGKVRTPYFWIISMINPAKPLVVYSKAGGIEDLDQFIKLIALTVEGN